MRSRSSRIVILILAFAVAFPQGLALPDASERPAASTALALTATTPAAPDASVLLAGKRRPGKHARQRDRKRHDARSSQRADGDPRAKVGPTKREKKLFWEEKCGGPGSVMLPLSRECSHGPDPAPPGADPAQPAAPLSAAAARRAAAMVCDGDGVSGPRVQVLYARASNVNSVFDTFVDSFRAWVADADMIMQDSAAAAGGSRRFRFVTPACQLDVTEVVLAPTADDSIDNMISAIKASGWNDSDRKYLVFAHMNISGFSGWGTLWDDDDPDQANWNNSGPSYALVFNKCWKADCAPATTAHELMHNLGGVQRSAPNATAGWHCIDEYDVMCYEDAPSVDLRFDCNVPALDAQYDCNFNDYFHPSPPANTYLATHWNSANSRFLIAPPLAITSPKKNAKLKPNATINVAASVSDPLSSDVAVEFRACAGSSCAWSSGSTLGTDETAPYNVSWQVPASGTHTLIARANDAGETLSAPVTVTVDKAKDDKPKKKKKKKKGKKGKKGKKKKKH